MNGENDLKVGDVFPLYLCDPEKNTRCTKTNCGELCFYTRFKQFAMSDKPVRYIKIAGDNRA